jgi:arsenite methyltransferase
MKGAALSDAARLRAGIRALVRRFSVSERSDVSCCGLTVAQAAALEALGAGGTMRLGDLGRTLGIAPSTLTRNLARLEAAGLVARASDPGDARSSRVRLTPRGERDARAVAAQEEAFAREVLERLPASRRAAVIGAVGDLLAAVRAATEDCCPGAFDHLVEGQEGAGRGTAARGRGRRVRRGGRPRPGPGCAERRAAMTQTKAGEKVVDEVRRRYGAIAVAGGSCCGEGPACCGTNETLSREVGYAEGELGAVPREADLGLGCGAPIAHLALRPGETVLDLGSGPGLDALLAARQVGSAGRVIGVDMTPEMLERARAAAARAGAAHVEFRAGRLEALPVDDASVDAVTSNCVINLVPDKAAVFREVARVLRPGGRVVVSDIVLERPLPEAVAADVLAWVGCVAGAADRREYFRMVESAGLRGVSVLREEDYAASLARVAADGGQSLLDRWGVRREELEGVVMSVTWRAVKP